MKEFLWTNLRERYDGKIDSTDEFTIGFDFLQYQVSHTIKGSDWQYIVCHKTVVLL